MGELCGTSQQDRRKSEPAFDALIANGLNDDKQEETCQHQANEQGDRVPDGGEVRSGDGWEKVFSQSLRDSQRDDHGNQRPWQPVWPSLAKPDPPDHHPSGVLERVEEEVMRDLIVASMDECGPYRERSRCGVDGGEEEQAADPDID